MESILDRQGIPSTLIDLQTGHQRSNNHPLGISTSWTPAECASILKPALNNLTESQGWRIIDGLHYETDLIIKKTHPKPDHKFGHILRQTKRQENLVSLEKKIQDIILGEINKSKSIESYIQNIKAQKDSIEIILSECLESNKLSQQSIEIFIKIINKMAREQGIKKIKNLNMFPVEPSPFADHWLSQYVTIRKHRNHFIKYLKRSSHTSKHNIHNDWAKVIISAVLFSGIFKYEWINFILESGPRSLKKIKKWIYYIDVWTDEIDSEIDREYQSPNWRWYPDPLSRHLILKCLQNNKSAIKGKIQTNKINQSISNILIEIGLQPANESKSLKHLCNISEAYWIYHFPSYIRSVFQSTSETRPLPERTLARLCYRKRLSADIPIKDKKVYIGTPSYIKESERNLKEYLILVKECINTAKSKNITSNSKQLSDLKSRLLAIHNNYNFFDISIILGQWLLHIIENGGHRGHLLALKTIDNYFFSIAKPLIIFIGYNKLEEYDEEIISEIYSKIVNYNNTDQSTRANQLFRFNLICSEYGLIDFNELDWGVIAGKWLTRKETRVDANIITPGEYYQTLDLLNRSKLDDYTKSWSSLFLILGYRFGLRIGEAHHIRWQDIQRLDDLLIVQVQRTILGRKKTPAAIRQIPLLGKFSTLEHKIIKNHLEHIKNTPGFTIKSFIFHDPCSISTLLPRHTIWNLIHSVLRSITGDPRIRFQHLRHSFATGQFISNLKDNAYLVKNESKNSLWSSYEKSINNNLTNPNTSQAYIMAALSCTIGHTRFATTLHSYIHLADDLATGYARKAPFPDINIQDLSLITGYKESTLKSRIRTKKLNKINFSAMDVLATIQIGDEISAYKFDLEKFPRRLNYDIKKPSIKIHDIYEILISTSIKNSPVDSIAFFKCIEKQPVKNIIKLAIDIENETKFTDFGLADNEGRWFSTHAAKSKPSINNEKNSIKNLLNKIDLLLNNNTNKILFSRAAQSWRESFSNHTSGSALIFSKPTNLSDFLVACKLLGYESTHFKFSYSNQLSNSLAKELVKNLNGHGIFEIKAEKIRRLENGITEERLNFVKSTLNKNIPNHLPKKLAALNQVFFILSVKLKNNFNLF